ncbi:MAG: pantoate--beta-alanine ligase [Verrucomicrobiae bacterium]|nr:pantoate--beta-alanine ligase [Verrucomicrobiae bacterium]
MKLIRSAKKMQQLAARGKRDGKRIVLVPTMGALHKGHVSLIRRARKLGDWVVVSIYVNATQFGRREDFSKYPRTLARDLELCREEKVDFVFAPKNLYEKDHSTWVEEKVISQDRCGRSRPNLFRGVTTVVSKLFHLVQPDVAVFGQKDAQQGEVVAQMVRDLNFPIKIVMASTFREKDGLAMSSRNRYLSVKERRIAPQLFQILKQAAKLKRGRREVFAYEALRKAGLRVDYVEEVNQRLCAAVWLGKTRLIDNVSVT